MSKELEALERLRDDYNEGSNYYKQFINSDELDKDYNTIKQALKHNEPMKVKVIDEPIELGELYKDYDIFDTDSNGKYVGEYIQPIGKITKAPQSYQYVYYKGEKCLLLSIKPQHLYNILLDKKTVEIRKSVPKEVKNE